MQISKILSYETLCMLLLRYNECRQALVSIVSFSIISLLFLGATEKTYSQNVQGTLEKLPAQKGCEGNPATLDVSSERMTFDSKSRTFTFEGNVRVLRCTIIITCNHLQVIRSEKGNTVERIIATQNVHFQQGTRSGVAERADYFESEQKLVLTGSPRVWDSQEHNELSGDEIVVMLQEERVLVKQARVLFHPSKATPKAP